MKNLLKEKLKNNQPVIGTFVALGHPDVTEMMAGLGFDWLLLDAEHGPLGYETLQRLMQAMNGSGCTPIVRPQWNDMVTIKRVLDIGAHGILVPMVNTREEAEYAVRACRYPPRGERGAGPRRAAPGRGTGSAPRPSWQLHRVGALGRGPHQPMAVEGGRVA